MKKKKGKEIIDPYYKNREILCWVACWRIRCAHSGNKENCFNCYSRKECDKAMEKIRKTLRKSGE